MPKEPYKSPIVTRSPAKFAYVNRQELDDMLNNPDFEFQLVPYYEKIDKNNNNDKEGPLKLNTTVTQYNNKNNNSSNPYTSSPPPLFGSIQQIINREPEILETNNIDEGEKETLAERLLMICACLL